MSLNKAIEHHKEHRKEYRGGKAIDKRCRNHGDCEWCKENRTHPRTKRELAVEQYMAEYEEELWDADPDCEHEIVEASGGGIKCTKCNGWFCY